MTAIQIWQLALVLIGAKVAAEFSERVLKQSAVLGELLVGVLLGCLFRLLHAADSLQMLSGLGAILLLFEIGLESDLKDLSKVGKQAFFVATLGVVLHLALSFSVGIALHLTPLQALFASAALAATSIGITARVFSDLKFLKRREATIVLGAAVVDDILSLVILAAVSGFAVTGALNLPNLIGRSAMAIVFLAGAIVVGRWVSFRMLRIATAMKTRAALSISAFIFCLALALLSQTAGLAPIVGAFAAGLVLNRAEQKLHFEEKLRSLADIFIPVFFVMMGANIDLATLNPATAAGRATLGLGACLSVVAVIAKFLAGSLTPARGVSRWIVGVGMIPRGEVALIFAGVGLLHNIIPPSIYAAIIMVVVVTTFITPPLLKLLIKPQTVSIG
jgi:Kef-type K+ transport system membrane component KefB